MAFGVFVLEPDALYYDRPDERYHFSARFAGIANDMVGDWIAYYEPTIVPRSRGFFAMAHVDRIEPHPGVAGLFVAYIREGDFVPFGHPVSFPKFKKMLFWAQGRSMIGQARERFVALNRTRSRPCYAWRSNLWWRRLR